MIGRVWCLCELMMERDRLTRGWFVCCQDLHVVEALIVANNKISNGSSANVLHLLDTRLEQDRCPLVASLDLEAREHDSTIFTGGLADFIVILEEILLELNKVHVLFYWGEHEGEGLALHLALGSILANFDQGCHKLLCDIYNICRSLNHLIRLRYLLL